MGIIGIMASFTVERDFIIALWNGKSTGFGVRKLQTGFETCSASSTFVTCGKLHDLLSVVFLAANEDTEL